MKDKQDSARIIEYGLIAALIAVVIIAAVNAFGATAGERQQSEPLPARVDLAAGPT